MSQHIVILMLNPLDIVSRNSNNTHSINTSIRCRILMNISKLVTLPLVVLFCVSCGSDGSTSSGAAVADILTAPATPTPAAVAVVEQFRTIIDDYGNTCRMENSTMCGGWGVALVEAEGSRTACGPGTAVNQWVQNFEWVPC